MEYCVERSGTTRNEYVSDLEKQSHFDQGLDDAVKHARYIKNLFIVVSNIVIDL